MEQHHQQPQQQQHRERSPEDAETAQNDPYLLLNVSPPLNFLLPCSIRRTTRLNTQIRDPNTGATHVVQDVLIPSHVGAIEKENEGSSDTDDEYSTGTEHSTSHDRFAETEGIASQDVAAAPKRRAFWMQKVLEDALYGRVWRGRVLQSKENTGCVPGKEEWEITQEEIAVKEMDRHRIQMYRDRWTENPIKEVQALEYLRKRNVNGFFGVSSEAQDGVENIDGTTADGTQPSSPRCVCGLPYSACCGSVQIRSDVTQSESAFGSAVGNQIMSLDTAKRVLLPLATLCDERSLYIITPYCSTGELGTYFREGVWRNRFAEDERFGEAEARHWMRQILLCLGQLQQAGVCHRDISPENLLIHDNGCCVVIDLGMCLLVPFERNSWRRYHMPPQGTCGKWLYMSPEIVANREPFDGFAIDLWAAGVILFRMLTGLKPWKIACDMDLHYREMSGGKMMDVLQLIDLGISEAAMDLLQRMLCKHPRERLTLRQVWDHPWMTQSFCQG